MKAISLWQPWATLIAIGAKRFETRSWGTSYRGPLAIHAAKRPARRDECNPAIGVDLFDAGYVGLNNLPYGCVVCVVDLVNCTPTEEVEREEWFEPHSERELAFGDFTPGRYAWQLENVRYLENLAAHGFQGLWEWDAPEGWG